MPFIKLKEQMLATIKNRSIIEYVLLVLISLFMLLVYMLYFYMWVAYAEDSLKRPDDLAALMTFPNLGFFVAAAYLCVFLLTSDKKLLGFAYKLKKQSKIRWLLYFLMSFLQVFLVYSAIVSGNDNVFIAKTVLVKQLYAIVVAIMSYFYTPAFPIMLIYEVWGIKGHLSQKIKLVLWTVLNNIIIQVLLLIGVSMLPVYLVHNMEIENEGLVFVWVLYFVTILFLVPLSVSSGMTKIVSLSKKYFIIPLILLIGLVFAGYGFQGKTIFYLACYAFVLMYIVLLILYEPMRKLRFKNEYAREELKQGYLW